MASLNRGQCQFFSRLHEHGVIGIGRVLAKGGQPQPTGQLGALLLKLADLGADREAAFLQYQAALVRTVNLFIAGGLEEGIHNGIDYFIKMHALVRHQADFDHVGIGNCIDIQGALQPLDAFAVVFCRQARLNARLSEPGNGIFNHVITQQRT